MRWILIEVSWGWINSEEKKSWEKSTSGVRLYVCGIIFYFCGCWLLLCHLAYTSEEGRANQREKFLSFISLRNANLRCDDKKHFYAYSNSFAFQIECEKKRLTMAMSRKHKRWGKFNKLGLHWNPFSVLILFGMSYNVCWFSTWHFKMAF